MDRRAYEVMNCITVVPGAVGAWRKQAILSAGGFSDVTLAEDADLTFAIIRNNYLVEYDDQAIALTEAPNDVKSFVKQRFRWMYGTFQTVWKHRKMFFNPKGKALGTFAMPNVVIFQIFFPLISPLIDLVTICAIFWATFQYATNPQGYSSDSLHKILIYSGLFILFEVGLSLIAFILEPKENKKLLIWVIVQRFYYRQIMYYVAVKTMFAVLRGALVGWNKFERSATVNFDNQHVSTPSQTMSAGAKS